MCPSSSAASKLIHEPHQKEQVSHKKKIPLKYYGLSAYNSTKKINCTLNFLSVFFHLKSKERSHEN